MTAAEAGALMTQIGQGQGVWILLPLAILEGPVISLLTGWLIALGLISPPMAFALILFGDVAGDCILYAIGRGSQPRMRRWLPLRLRPGRAQLARLIRQVRCNDAGLLIAGKLTHVAGFPVLLAAGAARVPLHRFILWNTLAAIPKAGLLLALGWAFGAGFSQIAEWLSLGSQIALAALAAGLGLWLIMQRRMARA